MTSKEQIGYELTAVIFDGLESVLWGGILLEQDYGYIFSACYIVNTTSILLFLLLSVVTQHGPGGILVRSVQVEPFAWA